MLTAWAFSKKYIHKFIFEKKDIDCYALKKITLFDGKTFIVAFDFDGTLIKGDSTLLFIFYLRGIIGLFCDFIILIPDLIKISFFNFDKKEIKQLIIKKALESTKYSKKK